MLNGARINLKTTKPNDVPGSKDGNFHIRRIFPKDEVARKGDESRIAWNPTGLNKLRRDSYIFEIRCLIFFLAAINSSLAALNRMVIYSAKTR